ncbi:MAG: hypothetical protein KDC85_19725 [Saprospiraceae bacterium]|nr:hypothetical protein [Saprospiraceae bacterium]MCB9324614.1 hypothetical protein [Lewinellaceae bacterium]
MTLKELFDLMAQNPVYLLFFFIVIPMTALLSGFFGKNEGHLSPWKYLYSTLIYLICVPGIFSVSLSIYMFLFEKRSIMDTDIYTQILPVFSMIFTLLIIRNNVDLDDVPGFGKLSALVMIISATLGLMWFIDRTHIIVFSYLRFEMVLLIFAILLILIRFGWYRIFSAGKSKT